MSDGPPEGMGAAQRESMMQASSSGSGPSIAAPNGIGMSTGFGGGIGQTLSQSSLDAISPGNVEVIMGAFPGPMDDNGNIIGDALANMGPAKLNTQSFDIGQMMGDTGLNRLSPGSQLNAENMPSISSKGREGG